MVTTNTDIMVLFTAYENDELCSLHSMKITISVCAKYSKNAIHVIKLLRTSSAIKLSLMSIKLP